MGITAVLETEEGKPVATVEDPTNVLHRILPADDPKYPCLRCIDWYGDTAFNYLQAPQFIAEWETLKREPDDAEVHRVVEGIRKLAQQLQNERHLYLKFYGD